MFAPFAGGRYPRTGEKRHVKAGKHKGGTQWFISFGQPYPASVAVSW
jgi:hypothetical protein